MHPTRALAAALLFSGLVALYPTEAHAAPDAERVEYLNKKAMEDYDSLEFDSARRTLVDCVAKLRAAGLDQTPLAAKTHVNLGIVYIAGFHDRGRGQQQFEKALAIDPTLKLDAAIATPDLQSAWDAAAKVAARKRRGSGAPAGDGGSAPAPTPPPTPAPAPAATPAPAPAPAGDALQHTPPDEVPPGQRVSLYAHPSRNIARATLYFRTQGQERYAQTTMGRSRKVPGDIVGQIPAEAVAGRSLQYYMEAYDAAGNVVGRQGSPESPFILSVTAGRPSAAAAPQAEDNDEDPLAQARREEAARNAPKPARDHVYFDVGMAVAGAVIAPGALTEVAWYYDSRSKLYEQARASSGGLIFGGLGLRAEVGAYVWKGLSLGVTGRFEVYTGHNADSSENADKLCKSSTGNDIPCYTTTSKGSFGVMVMGKLRYQFRRGSIFRPYVHFDIGGGEWRGALNIDGSKPTDPSSVLQPTDICSATYNGKTDAERMPENCKGPSAGYNSIPDPKPGPKGPVNLNRVCPREGACTDAVLMGRALIGVGGGFYLGGQHAGLSVDLSLIAAVGGAEFGLIPEISVGPQFIF